MLGGRKRLALWSGRGCGRASVTMEKVKRTSKSFTMLVLVRPSWDPDGEGLWRLNVIAMAAHCFGLARGDASRRCVRPAARVLRSCVRRRTNRLSVTKLPG